MRIHRASAYDESLTPQQRKRLGAWYTPQSLVDEVVANTIGPVTRGAVVRVLDPACGDGRFLAGAASWIRSHGAEPVLTGVDIDPGALRSVRCDDVELIAADALAHDWAGRTFDVVIGNPPFLSQMSSATVRVDGSRFGGGPYADAAADFLALALRLTRADGGRAGLVLPVSLLTARDAEPIRREVSACSSIRWMWWSSRPVFDATVLPCAIAFERGVASVDRAVRRSSGTSFRSSKSLSCVGSDASNANWGWLIADELGVPALSALATNGVVADRGLVTANFRDQYYGLVGAVRDDADGPPLVTTGLIDVATCHWGERPTRFAKQRFDAPRVDRSTLAPFMQRWVDRCLVPKVLVATQTSVLEAVVDEAGAWLPAVPVIRVVPSRPGDLWSLAAVLTSPTASALVAGVSVGSGLSPQTVRVSQRTLGAMPWPAGDVGEAVDALRDGDLVACARAVDAAYETSDDELLQWWVERAVVGWEQLATGQ